MRQPFDANRGRLETESRAETLEFVIQVAGSRSRISIRKAVKISLGSNQYHAFVACNAYRFSISPSVALLEGNDLTIRYFGLRVAVGSIFEGE